jgi:hypothetical protein
MNTKAVSKILEKIVSVAPEQIENMEIWQKALEGKSEGQLYRLKKQWTEAIQKRQERLAAGKPQIGDVGEKDWRHKQLEAIQKELKSRKGAAAGAMAAGTALTSSPDAEAAPVEMRSEFAARSPILNKAAADEKSMLSKGLEALSVPQKILMQKTAKALGVEVPKETGEAGEDADAASEALTEKAAEKLGIESPAAKAAIKTALDVGYDPLNLIGSGVVKSGVKAARKAGMLEKIMAKLGKAAPKMPTMAEREAAVVKQKLMEIEAQRRADVRRTANRIGPMGAGSPLPSEKEMAIARAKGKKELAKITPLERVPDVELTAEEKLIQASIDREKAAKREIAERVQQNAGKEVEKTEPLDEILNKVKKKK